MQNPNPNAILLFTATTTKPHPETGLAHLDRHIGDDISVVLVLQWFWPLFHEHLRSVEVFQRIPANQNWSEFSTSLLRINKHENDYSKTDCPKLGGEQSGQ